jgi:hypothetical protein
MTVGDLKKLLGPMNDALPVIVVAPCMDEDGDECQTWFQLREVTRKLDADIAEEYAHLDCTPLDFEK